MSQPPYHQQGYNLPPKKGLPVWTLGILVFAAVFVVGMLAVIILVILSRPGVEPTAVAARPTTSQSTVAIAAGPGFGISRDAASAHFQDLGFKFTDSPLNDGRQRSLGNLLGTQPMIELIGDPANLSASSLTLTTRNNDKASTNNLIYYTNDFLKFFLPNWSDGVEWVKNNLVKASTSSGGVKTMVGSDQVTLQSIGASDGVLVVLSVKAA